MPWRGASRPGEFPTLGFAVADWIEQHCVIPDGDRMGEPFVLTDEQLMFTLRFYALRPDASADDPPSSAWRYPRGGQLVRPQKWGKAPFVSALICAEAQGPVLFAGWDAAGEPVGRPWASPWIQVTAVSGDQTDNTWRALLPMIELGSLSADVPDTGETRINLPNGKIEPVTSSARSRLGQRITFAPEDETHSWLQRNGGRELARTQRRNLAGMGGRFLEQTNAWDPSEQSVAQQTYANPVGVLIDYPLPPAGSVRNKRERRKVMRYVYGDSAKDGPGGAWRGWIDLDRIDLEVEALLSEDAAQAERYFLNRAQAGESLVFDLGEWEAAALPREIERGSLITVGVDGARFDDALAIVACDVASGYLWPLAILERPEDAPEGYEHDLELADGAMAEAFDTFSVWRAYCDPQRIDKLIDRWQGRWGEKRVVEWFTNRPRQIGYAVRNYRMAVRSGDVSHSGDPVMGRHHANARRMPLNVYDEEKRPLISMQKERPHSPMKIDAAMAACLAWEARGDAIAADAKPEKKRSRIPISL